MVIGDTRISRKLVFVLVALVIVLLVAMFAMVACSDENSDENGNGGTASNSDADCAACHNDTTYLSGKATAWGDSAHGTNGSYVRAASAGCAGCHSGGGFSAMVAAGQDPGQVENGDANPTRQDCRACHQIHATYTEADWGLETTAAVALYAIEGATYDGGEGNLCVNCHQPRRGFEGYVEGDTAEVDSTHWGPHHGPQSAMLLGIGGASLTAGSPGAHYSMVENTCVSCHLGESGSHTFLPNVASCVSCHADAEDFDINGLQTEVETKLGELKEALIAKGLLDEEGEPVVGTYPVAHAAALWNWIYMSVEDTSLGVHNPAYYNILLEESMAGLAQ